MLASGFPSLLFLLLAFCWGGGCRHGARSQAKSFLRIEKNLLENGDWVNSIPSPPSGYANICSFNIQVLGKHKERQKIEAQLMAEALSPCALIAVQEITAPPMNLEFPNGDSLEADPETRIIFDAMTDPSIGFASLLSPEDTGRWINHSDGGGSEFFAFFYRPDLILPVDGEANGFLQAKLRGSRNCAKNEIDDNLWDRVPFAQSFRWNDGGSDFMLINNHLHAVGRKPCSESSETAISALTRRSGELNQIFQWLQNRKPGQEKDVIVLGDMNFSPLELELLQTGELPDEGEYELRSSYYDDVKLSYQNVYKAGFRSMNARCVPTNTAARACLDNALFNPQVTRNIAEDAQIQVLNLKGFVHASGYCDDKPAVCADKESTFARYFSDHNPIFFTWKLREDD